MVMVMEPTLTEIKEYMKEHIDEVQCLELLDLSTEEIVDAFEDRIEEKKQYLIAQLELDFDNDFIRDSFNNDTGN